MVQNWEKMCIVVGQNVVIESGAEIGGNAKIFPNVSQMYI
jgi:UDP-3-O-[3-hydroxymyristoyl] glucosamine N-acyltransferase